MNAPATNAPIAFLGMTHLGLNSAVAGAERGFKMIGFDPDPLLIERLKAGVMPVKEPKLAELAERHKNSITFTSTKEDLGRCEVLYVAPDIATDDAGHSDFTLLEQLLEIAFSCAAENASIVLLSQVPPGFSRTHVKKNKRLIYQVETLIFGQAIDRALNPERYIIGLADPRAPLPEAFESYLKGHGAPPILPMRYESAELAKIAINCCLVSSVSVANTLSELCETIGADWAEIIPTLKLDRRIGPYSYLSPGLGISGGNLERDLQTVIGFANRLGTHAGVVEAWLDNSRYRKDWPLRMLATHIFAVIKEPLIAILGLTYKENTHSVKNSPAVQLIRNLSHHKIKAYDPAIKPDHEWHTGLSVQASAEAAIKDADVLLLMTAWPEFRKINPETIAKLMRGKVVIDPFALLDHSALENAGLRHITLGKMPDADP